MAVNLLCLTTNGGLPIFTRKRGDCENLPFSTVASLNGFHIFFKSLNIKLESVQADSLQGEWSYIFEDCNNAVTIIVCGRGLCEILLRQLAEVTFAAISLFVSRDEMLLLDRIKKESKNFLPLIDKALENFIAFNPGLSDCVLANENSQLLQKMQDFSNQCSSLFCCLVIDQKTVVATEGWWDLNIMDREVLSLLLNSSNTLQNDVAIYLPSKSPNVAYRFVTIPLAPNTVLCVICGSNPTYNELHKTTQNIFRNEALGLIQNVERCIARSLPEQLEVDGNVLAMILANFETKKCVFSRNVQQSVTSPNNGNVQRLDMLKKFFYHTLQTSHLLEKDCNNTRLIEAIEQYWCSDYHKCFVLSDEYKNFIFVLFLASVPTYAMKLITQKLLDIILQEKNFCW